MLNVLIFTCRQSSQRINYYNALGKLCNLTVAAERKTPDDILQAYNVSPENYKAIYMHGIPMFGYMAFCPGVIDILKKHNNYDAIIIEQYSTPTALISINYLYRHHIPFIISADGGFTNVNEKTLKHKFKKSLISKASLWMTGGKGSIEYLAHYGANPERIKIFKFSSYSKTDQPNHQITEEEKNEIRNILGITEKKVLISVGRQVHGKGFDTLLRAIERLNPSTKDVGLYILGGSPNEECQELLGHMDTTNIHFPGLISKDRLKLYYQAADIFVFPTRYDVWGYPVNEAMSFGLPVITTYDCKAGLELIEEDINGYLVQAEDIDSLADRLQRLLSNDKKCEDMAIANYLKSKEYTSESMAESIYEIVSDFSKGITD